MGSEMCIRDRNIEINENDPKIKKLLDKDKDKEIIGYTNDGADASIQLIARRIIGEIPRNIKML